MGERISIIILNHNCNRIVDVVQRCLDLMQADDEMIVVCDNTNNMQEVQMLQEKTKTIRVLQTKEIIGNRSYNRNLGLSSATKDIALIMDGDILIAPNALTCIRQDFSTQEVVGVSGFFHLTMFTRTQIDLVDWEKRAFNGDILYETAEMLPNCIRDYRMRYDARRLNGPMNWCYFFTGFFAMRLDQATADVRFNEGIDGWGAEDIDFAYNLSRKGSLYFDTRIHNFHLPHERDHVKNLLNNHKNLYFCLACNPNIEFETVIAFGHPQESLRRIQQISANIDDTSDCEKPANMRENCIYTHLYKGQESANIFYKTTNGTKTFSLLGAALPLSTRAVEAAYLSGSLTKYPLSILCMILREHLRVAKEVFLVLPVTGSIYNESDDHHYFSSHIAQYVDHTNFSDIRMFSFREDDGCYRVESSLPAYEVQINGVE